MGKQEIWKMLIMDLFKNIDVGSLMSLFSFISVVLLGWSDIKRRRSEARKFDSEARVGDTTADTQMMSQIKQASIDLVEQLRKENAENTRDILELKREVKSLKNRIVCYEKLLKQANIDYSDCGSVSGPLTKE